MAALMVRLDKRSMESKIMDTDKLNVNKLRQEMRKRFPITKGAFASSATRDECVEILSGRETPEAVMNAWAKKRRPSQMTHVAIVPPGPLDELALSEGVHGEAPPAGTDTTEAVVDIAEAERLLRAIGKPELAGMVADTAKRAADAEDMAMSFDRGTKRVPSPNGTVEIAGVACPLRDAYEPDHPQHHAVPDVDENYRFDYWQANRECGMLTFNQTADDLIKLVLADERVLLVGPPGCGKTSVLTQFAALCGWPVTRFNGNRDVTMHEFVGTYEARGGETVWIDGPLPTAMKGGHLLILDEVDHMPAECSSVLHSVLEPGGMLSISGQKPFGPAEGFRMMATANTGGFGDETGLHPNAQVQDAAFLSRFGMAFHVDYMMHAHERNLLRKATGIDKDDADIIVKIATDTRKGAKEHVLMYPITLRQTLAWAKLVMSFDWGTAFSLTVLNKLPASDVPAVAEMAQRHLGSRLGGSIAAGS